MLMAWLFYGGFVIFLGGLGYKLYVYASTPAPLKIPTTPAPLTPSGVVFRMVREVCLFESLFKANLWTWIFGVMFHFGLLLVFIRHLRYVMAPVWAWVNLMQPLGVYGGMLMVTGLAGLLARRIFVERIRYISTPSDHLMLVLLLSIGCSGLLLKFFIHPDIIGMKHFILGWLTFNSGVFPEETGLYFHLGLVLLLMVIFPFSKLLHAPGVFFSPTRNQMDNSREKRHLSSWARSLDEESSRG